jgi:predicted Zn-dependent protease
VRGEILLKRDSRRARDCFDKSLAEPEAGWFDRLVIARIYLFHDMATAALKFAQDAVQMKSDHAYAWYLVARCQESIGWLDQAALTYERCLELAGDHDEARAALEAIAHRSPIDRILQWLGGLLRR